MQGPKGRFQWRRTLSLAALVGVSTLCAAQDIQGFPPTIEGYSPREIAMLPKYCIHTQIFRVRIPGGGDIQQIERWRDVMGPNFEAMHHYCWGLMKTNRALLLSRNGEQRLSYLNDALGEYDFVLRRADDSFVMLPEILTKKGANLVMLGRGGEAILLFERAVQVKPDYWPAYAELADFYAGVREAEKARETLQRGLAQSPGASALTRRLADLDKERASRKTREVSGAQSSAPTR